MIRPETFRFFFLKLSVVTVVVGERWETVAATQLKTLPCDILQLPSAGHCLDTQLALAFFSTACFHS